MKIGIYDPYLDDVGGGEKYMMTMASDLSRSHKVEVFWDTPSDLKRVADRFSLDVSNVTLVPNIFKKSSFVKKLLTTQTYDAIIYLTDGSLPIVFSKKFFVHIQQPLEQMQSSSLKSKIKLSRVTKFFCNSEYTKTFISRKFDLKTIVIYPPVLLNPQEIKKENIILHVGRFRVKNVGVSDYKKQGVMIDAFKQMVDAGFKKWKFVIASSVNDEQKAQFEEMKKTALGYPIEFLVNETNQDLWKTYSKAKIYWHASGFGEDLAAHPEFAEHFGISTVEAMGAGAVPVVINAGGQKEIVTNGENGYLWDTIEELKADTLKLADHEKELEKMSVKARTRAADFSAGEFEKRVNDMVRS